MKIKDISAINDMRLKGYSTATIAAMLRMSPNTVKSYIRRHPEMPGPRICPCCGKTVKQPGGHREKKFCSDRCRMAYWNSHQDQVNRQAYYTLTCQKCGKEFESYGNRNRKYCCRACYVASRQPG